MWTLGSWDGKAMNQKYSGDDSDCGRVKYKYSKGQVVERAHGSTFMTFIDHLISQRKKTRTRH